MSCLNVLVERLYNILYNVKSWRNKLKLKRSSQDQKFAITPDFFRDRAKYFSLIQKKYIVKSSTKMTSLIRHLHSNLRTLLPLPNTTAATQNNNNKQLHVL